MLCFEISLNSHRKKANMKLSVEIYIHVYMYVYLKSYVDLQTPTQSLLL